jgi:archaemetzincin
MKIILQPATANLNNNTLHQLAKDISIEFKDVIKHVKVNIASSIIEPHTETQFQLAFDGRRNQWNSPTLLDWFFEKFKPNRETTILVILDVDAYSNGLNFVLREAFHKGGLGAVYLARIKGVLWPKTK